MQGGEVAHDLMDTLNHLRQMERPTTCCHYCYSHSLQPAYMSTLPLEAMSTADLLESTAGVHYDNPFWMLFHFSLVVTIGPTLR